MNSLRALQAELAQRLRLAGVPSPEVDARELLMRVLGLSRTELLTSRAEPSAAQLAQLETLIRRREAREPLQHLLGEVDWGGVRLKVGAAALIPRPETEVLLELALDVLRDQPEARVLDVGTGTGALALGLKAALPGLQVQAGDVSEDALALARQNANLNGLDVKFSYSDLLAAFPGPFDLIVSNPPYLPEADRSDVQPEVSFDPALALYAGSDGLNLARPLAAQAVSRLAPGGVLLLELDPRNVEGLARELSAQGWRVHVHPDLAGRRRFLEAHREGWAESPASTS